MKHYKVAELIVKMSPEYAPLLPQSKEYEYQGNEEAICDLTLQESDYLFYERMYPEAKRDLIEYMVTGTRFYTKLVSHSGLLLHASAVELDGAAYLFSAPSGTGKSTHTALWIQEFAPRAQIINDDKPAIRILPDGIYVYGTPWSGKTDLNRNKKVPLKGIAFLSRGEQNSIRPATADFAIRSFLEETVRFKEREMASDLLDLIGKIVEHIPIYQMVCNMDAEAAHVAYDVMSKGEIK